MDENYHRQIVASNIRAENAHLIAIGDNPQVQANNIAAAGSASIQAIDKDTPIALLHGVSSLASSHRSAPIFIATNGAQINYGQSPGVAAAASSSYQSAASQSDNVNRLNQFLQSSIDRRNQLLRVVVSHRDYMINICQQRCTHWYQRVDSRVIIAASALAGAGIGSLGFLGGPLGFFTTPLGAVAGALIGAGILLLLIYILTQGIDHIARNQFNEFLGGNNQISGKLFCYLLGIVLCENAQPNYSKIELERYLLLAIGESRRFGNNGHVDELIRKAEEAYMLFLGRRDSILLAVETAFTEGEALDARYALFRSDNLHSQAKGMHEEISQLQVRINSESDISANVRMAP